MAKEKIKPENDNIAELAASPLTESDTDNLTSAEKKEKKKQEKAKKKQEKAEKKAEKKRNRPLILKILPYIFLLSVIGIAVAVIGFNFMGLREQYLRTTIDQIPMVNSWLPAPLEEDPEDPTSTMQRDELADKVKQLEAEITNKDLKIESLNKRIEEDNAQITSLTTLTEQQEKFRQEKAEFDEMIATGKPADYAKYYESIQPDNAADLYKQVVGVLQQSQEMKKYAETVSGMDEASAAKMLEVLVPTDMTLVVQILKSIDSAQSSTILGSMTPENAAAILKQMAPPQG